MDREVVWSLAATEDLESIVEYIFRDSEFYAAAPLILKSVKKIFQNVFAVSGRQLARRDSRYLTEKVSITESAMKMATPTKTTSTL